MTFTVRVSDKATKQLKKLDAPTRNLIVGWLRKNLEGTEEPRRFGKALSGNMAGYWRYRVGDYRILAEIHDNELIILVVQVAHRREVYRR